jgi:hypothetical protein
MTSASLGSIAKTGTNGTGDIGQTNNRFGVMYGTSTSAFYADLAEKYLADREYEVGTVMMVGGDKEVTAATLNSNAIGVVSANPAIKMNDALEGGTYIALKGRVPVKVEYPVKKGDTLIAGHAGVARVDPLEDPTIRQFAIALESNDSVEIKLIECVIL